MYNSNKRGQVTLFIILAILIVAFGFLIYLFYPKIQGTLGLGLESPQAYIQTCLEEDIQINLDMLSLQGGSLDPTNYILYGGEKIEYLCYTANYYESCVMQRPLLKQHIESEIKKELEDPVQLCFDALKESYESKGYEVNLQRGLIGVEILPQTVLTTLDYSLTLTKDSVENYDSFNVIIHNNLYELLGFVNSILNWETKFGKAEITNYMDLYHDLKVEKKEQQDGSTIYILSERVDGTKFQFASRSYAWPPGYGV